MVYGERHAIYACQEDIICPLAGGLLGDTWVMTG